VKHPSQLTTHSRPPHIMLTSTMNPKSLTVSQVYIANELTPQRQIANLMIHSMKILPTCPTNRDRLRESLFFLYRDIAYS